MKSYILSFLILFTIPLCTLAQSSDKRTVSTKIADVLAKFPANDKSQYEANVKQLQSLGEEGLQQLLQMFTETGKGDNTALEYAISAYSSSVMKKGNASDRKTAVTGYCNALQSLSDIMNKEFIIRQLQLIGNDDALSCLQPFLNDDKLAGPAARAIAQINSDAAAKLLLASLNSGKDKASIIEGLGYMRHAAAAPAIEKLYTNEPSLQKVAGYALARIASVTSEKLLHEAAKKTKFAFHNSGATAYYIVYLRQLAATNQLKQAARLAGTLMTEATAAKQPQARIAALTLITEINGSKSLPLLHKTMKDDDIEYRAAALKLAAPFTNSATDRQWLNTIKTVSQAQTKAQIITFLGNSKNKTLATELNTFLQHTDSTIRHAAITSVAKNGQEDAVPVLIDVLKKGNKEDMHVVKTALLTIAAGNMNSQLAASIDNLPPAATVTALEVLAARRADNAGDKVFALAGHQNDEVRQAALKALQYVATEKDLPRLFERLSSSNDNEVKHVQDAITAASSYITDTAKRSSVITAQMDKTDDGKKYLFVPTLASIGGRQALQAVELIYKNGNDKARKTVISALAGNKDQLSASMLLDIATSSAENKAAAVDGYINIIQKGSFPADQKVLMLQDAMTLAVNDVQRKRILQEAGRNRTFLSLVFAGKYIDNASLQQDAAFAVMNIALANPDFNGQMVRDLLQKVSGVIKGGDSEYQKEAIRKHLADMPAGEGFVPMFNGKDLTGWKGLVDDPLKRSKMSPKALQEAQKKADAKMKEGWVVQDGLLVFTGHGDNLATVKQYGDFEMIADWKITAEGDAGIYLRGTPQVQIWDTSRRDVGAEVGSGGLYNNQKYASKPLKVADNKIGEWNNFRIIMKDDKVTVYLNGELVTDNVPLENYWDRNSAIFPKEQIELQAHGTYVAYRNLYIKELAGSKPFELSAEEKKDKFKILFDGTNLNEWVGNKKDYIVENNELIVKPSEGGGGGNLFTKDEYKDFNFRFEFLLTPGANNGLGIRAPLEGDAAYEGMELQILDNEADIYKDLKPYQYHGSVYGILAAKRGYLKPVGEWNQQEVIVNGTKIKVILNNQVILDGDIKSARDNGAPDKQPHPGLKKEKGHIGFLGHGSVLKFRNIRIKEL